MQTDLTEQEIRDEVSRLAPFHHKVQLPYDLSTHVPELSLRPLEYTRISNLVKHAFPALLEACGGSLQGKRVLDVACNCGGFVIEAAKLKSEYVLGVDITEHYIEQAKFIKRALGMEQVDFRRMNIENIDEEKVGLFDVSFCFGILYHLENPVLAMKRLASVTKEIMLVDTRVMQSPPSSESLWSMNFPAVAAPASEGSTTSLWRSKERFAQFTPSESAVVNLLGFLGFSKVGKIMPIRRGWKKGITRENE